MVSTTENSVIRMADNVSITDHQSPLRGLSGTISLSGSVLPKIYDKDGKLQYDTTVRVGHSTSRIIYTRDLDSRTRPIKETDVFPRPSQEEIEATTFTTRRALETIINQRIQSSLPKQQSIETISNASSKMTLVSYKPSASNLLMNPDAPPSRTIKMVEAQVDPLDPAKFKHRKIPRGPPSPPVPVLHSPIRKATSEEYKAWIVPPSISNWKNPKGYTIPLDKRLACDGRSLQEFVINDKFASFAESLYVAEAHAREEVSRRNALERTLAANERQEKEARLREIAKETRAAAAHSGFGIHSRTNGHDQDHSYVSERDALRKEAASRRVAEYNRKGFTLQSQERDISEKIALNVPIASASSSFDTRLFNQSEGVSSGFAPGDDTYSVYEKPLFTGSVSSLIYKPTLTDRDADPKDYQDTSRSSSKKMHKEPQPSSRTGLGMTRNQHSSEDSSTIVSQRTGPVMFERGGTFASSTAQTQDQHEDDPFGLDSFLQAAKRGKHSK